MSFPYKSLNVLTQLAHTNCKQTIALEGYSERKLIVFPDLKRRSGTSRRFHAFSGGGRRQTRRGRILLPYLYILTSKNHPNNTPVSRQKPETQRELHIHAFSGADNHSTVVRQNEDKNATGKTEFESAALPNSQKLNFSLSLRVDNPIQLPLSFSLTSPTDKIGISPGFPSLAHILFSH
jgi:hypothetical protein